MSTVDELIATARKNEKIARNLFDIEVAIMNINDCSDFFGTLVDLIAEKFELDHVWVSLVDVPANQHFIHAAKKLERESFLKRVPMVDYLHSTQSSKAPLLVNTELRRLRNLLPKDYKSELASVAILPLVVESRNIGALMLGSTTPHRYDPRKDNFFLKQLSVKASVSLTSVWARERISFLATRDPLTLLRNRRELEECLDQELSRHARQREDMAVMFIDCDDFKLVNDTYGHDVGDLYLKHVASHLDDLTRKSDLAFRFAGDEFVVILPHQQQAGAELLAQRIRQHLLDTPLKVDDSEIPVAISYGVISTEDLKQVDSKLLLKMADDRLYEMKKLKPKGARQVEPEKSEA